MWRIHEAMSTGSTNADVAAVAAEGEPEGYVLVAGEQTMGRGRLGRAWTSPPGSSLSVSVLLRPADVAAASWPWLPLLVGVAVVDAVQEVASVNARLKWPNDVLLDGAKLAGILVERTDTPEGPTAVAGVGMNITAVPDDAPDAASLSGTTATRDDVLHALLNHLATRYTAWRADPASATLAQHYQELSDTIGRDVRVDLPGGATVTGRAAGVDASGGLVVATPAGEQVISAGDVIHVRPSSHQA